jgi:alpha-tubulin suppressor-like RCC1 family protein
VAAGAVQCWGYGQYGQLGNGVTLDSDVPVPVTGLPGATLVASGGEHSCAVDTHHAIWCWGNDQSGQLGDNGSTDSPSPVQVAGVTSTATSLGLGAAHSCAVLGGRVVACWGWNVKGQLGNGSTTDSPLPVEVTGF